MKYLKKKMNMMLVAAAFLLLGALAQAQVPQLINYQGVLKDSFGTPINATVNMTFAIYDVSSGGTALWSETQNGVPVAGGLFNVHLGSTTPLPADLFSGGENRWLGVKVGADLEMTPRHQIVSVGYALKAEDADTLGAGLVIVDKTTGNMGIGTTSPVFPIDVAVETEANAGVFATNYGNTNWSPTHVFRKAGCTMASPCATPNGHALGFFGFRGHDGIAFTGSKAFFQAITEGTWSATNNGVYLKFATTQVNTTNTTEKMRIAGNGNVGIGTTSPADKLHVAGNVRANSFITASSREVKKQITPLDQRDYQDILQQINELQMVRFLYKDDGDRHPHLGVIAEESPQQILDQTGKAISLSDYASFLLAGLKAQSEQIKALTEEIQALEARLAK
jgi:hypothetical protein